LEEDGFVVYLPLKKVLKVYSGRKKWVEEPIFKSYVFVKTSEDLLYQVVNTVGKVHWVKYAGKPATIREDHLQLIYELLKSNTTFEITKEKYTVGDEITMSSGPFIGFKGHVIQLRGKNKLIVVLDKMESTIVVEIPVGWQSSRVELFKEFV
jgi:transcription antitermination factor NusG